MKEYRPKKNIYLDLKIAENGRAAIFSPLIQ